MSKQWTTVVLTAGLLAAGFGVAAGQEAPPEVVMMQVEFITTPVAEPDPAEGMWKYLETATLEGSSQELLALNGLRVGKLDARFQKEFDAVLKKMNVLRRFPQVVQMLPGRPQEFNIGLEMTDRTMFIWKTVNSFVGRRLSRARFGIMLLAQPDANQRAKVGLTPLLSHGDALNQYLDLTFLAVNTSMQSGQTLVLMPTTGVPTGLGAGFYYGLDRGGRQRTFIVITLNSIRGGTEP